MHMHGLKALGLSLIAALGLMALFAVGTQAENLSSGGTAGQFKVLGSAALATNIPIVGTALAGLLLIPSKNAYIECTGGKIEGKIISSTEGLVVVLFEGCETFEHSTKKLLPACGILGDPASIGKIQATAIALPKLHEGKLFVLFENEPGKPLASIKFHPECGIGVLVNVTGSVVAEVDNSNEALDHLFTFSEAIQKLFQIGGVGDKLLYGAAEAFLLGVGHVNLGGEGPHRDKNWSVV